MVVDKLGNKLEVEDIVVYPCGNTLSFGQIISISRNGNLYVEDILYKYRRNVYSPYMCTLRMSISYQYKLEEFKIKRDKFKEENKLPFISGDNYKLFLKTLLNEQ